MRPLPLHPLPIPTEPLTDYLERLAIANGYHYRELWDILNKGGLSHDDVLTTIIGGFPLPQFSGPSDRRVVITVNLFGLKPEDFTHTHKRWCPLCISEAAWFRPYWRLKIATICNKHGVKLLQLCPVCNTHQDTQAILNGRCSCGANFSGTILTPAWQGAAINRVLEESLNGKVSLSLGEAAAVLDTPQLTRLICYTGRFLEGPSMRKPGQIRELESLKVAENIVAGASVILSNWPMSFWHCLDGFVQAAPQDASIRRVFGRLYHVIYHDLRASEFQFIRDAFEEFLLEHWRGELCGRHRLFSEKTIQGHRHQGIARVVRAAGMSSKRLRKMIHQDGFPAKQFDPEASRNIITVDKALLAQLIPDAREYLDFRAVSRIFRLSRPRLRQLITHGAILADAKPDFRISNRWHFRRTEVERFVAQIRENSSDESLIDGTISLNYALQFWRISATEFSDLITALKKRLVSYISPSGFALGEVRFRKKSLRDWLDQNRQAVLEWISVSDASKRLGLKEQVVYELVAKNLINARVTSKSGHATRKIALSSLTDFSKKYVSAAEVARQRGSSVTATLKDIKIRPITGLSIDGGRQYFYSRDAISLSNPAGSNITSFDSEGKSRI